MTQVVSECQQNRLNTRRLEGKFQKEAKLASEKAGRVVPNREIYLYSSSLTAGLGCNLRLFNKKELDQRHSLQASPTPTCVSIKLMDRKRFAQICTPYFFSICQYSKWNAPFLIKNHSRTESFHENHKIPQIYHHIITFWCKIPCFSRSSKARKKRAALTTSKVKGDFLDEHGSGSVISHIQEVPEYSKGSREQSLNIICRL